MPRLDPLPASPRLHTARLSFRRPAPSDVDAIFAIHRDQRTTAHNPSDALSTRGDAEDLFKRWDDHWTQNGYGYWVVRRADSESVVGFCGFKVMTLQGRRVLNLFYRFDPSAWGDGLASEAATAVVEWARITHPDCPIVARVRPENIASARVASRAGLVRTEHLDELGEDGLDWIFASRLARVKRA